MADTTTAPDEATARVEATARRPMPAGRVFVVILVALLVWTLLYAPELRRSARAAPLGTRRSISLAVLGPLAWISDHTGLTAATDAAASAAGRDPNAAVGDVDAGTDPLPPAPSGSPKPLKPVVEDSAIREPTADRQLRIAVVGDSLAQGIGFATEQVFRPYWTEVYKQGRISTGLARLDYFDWMAQMQTIVNRANPDLVIVMLGENDNQGLQRPDGTLEQDIGTYPWAGAYEERVERFARIATSRGKHLIWVGLPNERDRGRWDFIQKQNGIFAAVADRLPNVGYVDTWDLFAAPDGGYSAFWRDGNKVREIRAPDGVHFNADGYELVMREVARYATEEFDLAPKTYDG